MPGVVAVRIHPFSRNGIPDNRVSRVAANCMLVRRIKWLFVEKECSVELQRYFCAERSRPSVRTRPTSTGVEIPGGALNPHNKKTENTGS